MVRQSNLIAGKIFILGPYRLDKKRGKEREEERKKRKKERKDVLVQTLSLYPVFPYIFNVPDTLR